ncbi:MAG: glycoside hydrolase family 2 protein [Acidimicrobiales bacterium]
MTEARTGPGRLRIDLRGGWRLWPGGRDGLGVPRELVGLPWEGFAGEDYEVTGAYERSVEVPQDRLEGAGPEAWRAFLDFEGVMASARAILDGEPVAEHEGGFTSFSVAADRLLWPGRHLVRVEVDAHRRATIPPFGGLCDYDTPGGIWGGVTLRVVPPNFLAAVSSSTRLDAASGIEMRVVCRLDVAHPSAAPFTLSARLVEPATGTVVGRSDPAELGPAELGPGSLVRRSGQPQLGPVGQAVAGQEVAGQEVAGQEVAGQLTIPLDPARVRLWSVSVPAMYRLEVQMQDRHGRRDRISQRVGLREVGVAGGRLTINTEPVELVGLSRHATFPYLGLAAGRRSQRSDAQVLRDELNCNIVRTSHYPQSPRFLDACDEIGLMVLEEVPGWQHVGDARWKELLLRDLEAMISRDCNHPSIVLWGTRVNESDDDAELYAATNALAHRLDPSRPTTGSRRTDQFGSELIEDVFSYNSYGLPVGNPGHVPCLITEHVGQYEHDGGLGFSRYYRRTDPSPVLGAQARRHASAMHDISARDDLMGGIGWTGFDYNSDVNSYRRVKYPGVCDIFRLPKPGAAPYQANCDPQLSAVLAPAFYWDEASLAAHREAGEPMVAFTNCESLTARVGATRLETRRAPRLCSGFSQGYEIEPPPEAAAELRLDALLGGEPVATVTMSADRRRDRFFLACDEQRIVADGSDSARVVFGVSDAFGNFRHGAGGEVLLSVTGPGELVGPRSFDLAASGGVGAVWLRATLVPGLVVLSASHPLGRGWARAQVVTPGR